MSARARFPPAMAGPMLVGPMLAACAFAWVVKAVWQAGRSPRGMGWRRALLMLTWTRALQTEVPRAIAPDYLDDLVGHVTGGPRECVEAVWRMEDLARRFAEASATTAQARRLLGKRPGFPVVAAWASPRRRGFGAGSAGRQVAVRAVLPHGPAVGRASAGLRSGMHLRGAVRRGSRSLAGDWRPPASRNGDGRTAAQALSRGAGASALPPQPPVARRRDGVHCLRPLDFILARRRLAPRLHAPRGLPWLAGPRHPSIQGVASGRRWAR